MFIMCLFVWIVVVDNAVMPKTDQLRQDVGEYSRYRVRKWSKNGKLDLLKDQILVYAVVKNREQIYYMDHSLYFEAALKGMEAGTPIQLRYSRRAPKIWKRHCYDIRSYGSSMLRYSPGQLIQRQRQINKFSMIMGGVYLALVVLGIINRPRTSKPHRKKTAANNFK